MASTEIRYSQVISAEIAVEKLPDGTTAVLDQRSKNVHSLNASATVVWEACKEGATLAQVREALAAHSGAAVDESLAISALSQLSKVNLIQSDAPVAESIANAARRSTLMRVSMIAVPLVLSLAFVEQKAAAQAACSRHCN